MPTRLSPYLGFLTNAREAMEFYQFVFGGQLDISTFADLHASTSPEEDTMVMHSQLTSPNGLVLMASDTPTRIPYTPGNTFSVSLSGEDDAELRGYWDALSIGADVTMPLTVAQWGDAFGMLDDRFGVRWLVNITAAPAP
jgi:PhnB protein